MGKKPTIKQLEERLNLVTSQLNFTMRMLDSVGVAFSQFVKFLNKDEEFKKYLEKSKNLHKLSKEEEDARKKGHLEKTDDVPTEEVRKEKNAETQS
tara:strand:- start:501 stop:788 length:288 start_codon:yes stop_codon:yes gene_type:complete